MAELTKEIILELFDIAKEGVDNTIQSGVHPYAAGLRGAEMIEMYMAGYSAGAKKDTMDDCPF